MKQFYSNLSKLLLVVCCLGYFRGSAQLVVNNSATATQLANKIVGSGVTISNVSLNNGSSVSGGTGIFSNGNTTNIGLTDGVLLTTGKATDAIGANGADTGNDNTDLSEDQKDFTDDPNLAAIATASIRDQSILKFDFVAQSDFITVQYVFASDEYNEWVCSQYNDLFAFFRNRAKSVRW